MSLRQDESASDRALDEVEVDEDEAQERPVGSPPDIGDALGAGSRGRSRLLVAVAIVVVLALIGAVAWWLVDHKSSGGTAAASTVPQVVDVTTGTVDDTVTADGTVAAATTDDLSFGVSGKVTAVNVKVGDKVKTGQVLATVDSAELLAAFQQAQADYTNAQAKLSDDQDAAASDEQIAADEAALAVSKDTLDDAYGALAGASLVATTNGTVTTVNLTVGEQLGSGGTGGTSQTGSQSGSGASSGNVGNGGANGASGQNGSASTGSTSTPDVQVISTGSYTVDLSVDSSEIASVKAGQPATVSLSSSTSSNTTGAGAFPGGGAFPGAGAFPGGGNFPGGNGANANSTNRGGTGNGQAGTGQSGSGTTGRSRNGSQAATSNATATGKVSEVSSIADASSGVAEYTATVSFTADPTDFAIGSNVSVAITTATRTDAVLVPTRAITTTGGRSTVVVATDGTPDGATETRDVQTGSVTGAMTEISNGLTAGEKVIVEVPAAFAQRGENGGFPGAGGEGGAFPGGGAPTGVGGGRAPVGATGSNG